MSRYIPKTTMLPAKFAPGFFEKMDGRRPLVREMRSTYAAVISDLGGPDNLSTIKKMLVEKLVWLYEIMGGVERQLATADKDQASELLSRWTQSVNAFVGLSRTLGIERRAKSIPSLEAYVASKDRKKV